MSRIALSPPASGTATFTLAAPATNTDRTLSLPDAAGTIQVSGNPISGTTGTFTGLVDISAAGAGQIVFPATQNASSNANTLDDYEEGTWTPAFLATGYTFTYTNQEGIYTKIGRMVYFKIYLRGSYATGSGTVMLNIIGFPFTSGTGLSQLSTGSMTADTGSAFFPNVPSLLMFGNSTSVRIQCGFNSATSQATFNISTLPAGTEIEAHGFYYV